MGGTRWSEDLAGEAILQFDCLAVDDHLLSPGRGPVAGTAISHILGKIKERDIKIKEKRHLMSKLPHTLQRACGVIAVGVLSLLHWQGDTRFKYIKNKENTCHRITTEVPKFNSILDRKSSAWCMLWKVILSTTELINPLIILVFTFKMIQFAFQCLNMSNYGWKWL